MNLLVKSGILTKLDCGSNFAYILQNNSDFSSTEYKVLQSQVNGSFVKCMKMLYNGKVELYYITNSYKPLLTMLSQIDADTFITIVSNLLAGIIDVKSNGFLVCNNIDSSMEHIFVDPNTLKVRLIYIPLSCHEYNDESDYENVIRTSLVKIIASISSISSPKTLQLSENLQNGMYSIEEVFSHLVGKSVSSARQAVPRIPNEKLDTSFSKGLRIVAVNAPSKFEFDVNKPEFVIGKKETNDGVIPFNKMISRVHCKIMCLNGKYTIQDMQSVNGTFVNNVRLQPGQSVQIKNGDIIRLANSSFNVVIR